MSCTGIFGVQNTFGITAPVGGIVRRARRNRRVEPDEVEGADSEVARVCPMSFGKETVELSGRGTIGIVSLVASVVTAGTHTVVSRTVTEFQSKEPEFEVRSVSYFSTNPTP